MRRKTTKTGASRFASLLLSFVPLFAVTPWGSAAQKPEPAVVAGTVFREPGFALPGAEVELIRVNPPDSGRRPKPLRTRTDARGEFAFQVAPEAAEYRVTARARGYVMEERTIRLSGGPERMDVYLTLKPAGSDLK